MTKLFDNLTSDAKANAQRNLLGRTHYVDDDTLRWHKARILSARSFDGGLLFGLIESVPLDMHNTRRGCRYVVFDIFGHVISRVALEDCWRTRDQASKAMWAFLNTVDSKAMTAEAIEREEHHFAKEMSDLRATLADKAA